MNIHEIVCNMKYKIFIIISLYTFRKIQLTSKTKVMMDTINNMLVCRRFTKYKQQWIHFNTIQLIHTIIIVRIILYKFRHV